MSLDGIQVKLVIAVIHSIDALALSFTTLSALYGLHTGDVEAFSRHHCHVAKNLIIFFIAIARLLVFITIGYSLLDAHAAIGAIIFVRRLVYVRLSVHA